ncbi:uncharacterized protein PV09_03866 [Verruconis gallopava]|uniref:Ca2+-modulated nonselective cation channel polycystin n=1 Tax=Verruconis gallopava TaxID=253628 RepID=A0A0D2AFS6_9PEZI|nr:uncharacterized protein PV09_03866 [Verruconis gallopava]KIW05350.1 hypothetical protein PV09_03866 [Verruconis gallopava]
MAAAEAAIRPHDRQKARRPFATWMKRLANLKSSGSALHNEKKSLSRNKRKNNNPYPESGYVGNGVARPKAPSTISGRASSFTPASVNSGRVGSFASYADSTTGGPNIVIRSNKSTAPTLATNPETIQSDTGFSRTGTAYTTDGLYSGRANSTFSSARASQESLTTTLTTIQSTAPSAMLPATNQAAAAQSPVTFSHQYPVSPPASAVPAHMQQSISHPHTYTAATANGLLSDNASILTLASSSKRRRRNSLDTQASIRAIAPSSVWGNSRESLPLSVLSANIDRESAAAGSSTGGYGSSSVAAPPRPSLSGLASAERASVYSNPGGVGAPALVSERNSYYSTKLGNDGASVRSGHLGLGHGRAESINGSITGLDRTVDRAATVTASPLASPREGPREGEREVRASRRMSGRRDREGADADVEEEDEESTRKGEDDEDLVKVDSGKGKGKEKEVVKKDVCSLRLRPGETTG